MEYIGTKHGGGHEGHLEPIDYNNQVDCNLEEQQFGCFPLGEIFKGAQPEDCSAENKLFTGEEQLQPYDILLSLDKNLKSDEEDNRQ